MNLHHRLIVGNLICYEYLEVIGDVWMENVEITARLMITNTR